MILEYLTQSDISEWLGHPSTTKNTTLETAEYRIDHIAKYPFKQNALQAMDWLSVVSV